MDKTEHRSFATPTETRSFPHGRAEILAIDGDEVGRLVFEPGWRWSTDVKPIAGTESCEAPHYQYHVAGQLAIRMDDGAEFVAGPGDITCLPSGHDAWVVGDEPAVTVDWYGASNYARPPGAGQAPGTPAAVVAQFNKAWNDHDLPAALALVSEDCVFESTSPAPDGERAVGKSALRAAWTPIFADASSTFTVEDSFSAGTRLVQRWRYDWTGGHIRGVDVIAVRDGLVTEKLAYVKG